MYSLKPLPESSKCLRGWNDSDITRSNLWGEEHLESHSVCVTCGMEGICYLSVKESSTFHQLSIFRRNCVLDVREVERSIPHHVWWILVGYHQCISAFSCSNSILMCVRDFSPTRLPFLNWCTCLYVCTTLMCYLSHSVLWLLCTTVSFAVKSICTKSPWDHWNWSAGWGFWSSQIRRVQECIHTIQGSGLENASVLGEDIRLLRVQLRGSHSTKHYPFIEPSDLEVWCPCSVFTDWWMIELSVRIFSCEILVAANVVA